MLISKIVMPLSLDWPKSQKTGADNADNIAISCAVRSDGVPVGRRSVFFSRIRADLKNFDVRGSDVLHLRKENENFKDMHENGPALNGQKKIV